MGIAALERRNERDAVLQSLADGLAFNTDHDDRVFKGKAIHDVFEAKDPGRVDLVAADGAAGHEGAVGGVGVTHEVADEVAEVGFAGADGGEAGVERGEGVTDWFLELGFEIGG